MKPGKTPGFIRFLPEPRTGPELEKTTGFSRAGPEDGAGIRKNSQVYEAGARAPVGLIVPGQQI